MSAGIPESLNIDFSEYKKDLVEKAWSRMLLQFWNSPVFKGYIAALIESCPQWGYDQILKFIDINQLYKAEGENLDAIGRIVDQGRTVYEYSEDGWWKSDDSNQGQDNALSWVTGAALEGSNEATDDQYRYLILSRIVMNFNRFSSIPELQYIFKFLTGENVSFRTSGMMQAEIYVNAGLSRTNYNILTSFKNNSQVDGMPMIPYPATLDIDRVWFLPNDYWISDILKDENSVDNAKASVYSDLGV